MEISGEARETSVFRKSRIGSWPRLAGRGRAGGERAEGGAPCKDRVASARWSRLEKELNKPPCAGGFGEFFVGAVRREKRMLKKKDVVVFVAVSRVRSG